jgi:hypothetical protein
VLEKQKQLLGDNHPDTLRTIGNLAIIQRRLRIFKQYCKVM